MFNVRNPSYIELLDKFVELTVVDADEVECDAVNVTDRDFFLQKTKYKQIEFKEVISKKLDLLLVSGIAGIGKTWLLQKCLLDWAKGSIWQNIELVFYLECRKINQYENIHDIDELLNRFYKSVLKDSGICPELSTLFIIDGLDEFVYLKELLVHSPQQPSKYPIVKTLADVLDIQKHKCVVAGRVGAIISFKDKVRDCKDRLAIQVMGFNNAGICNFIMKSTKNDQMRKVERVLEASWIAKSMASVPFYLTAMCAIITAPLGAGDYSFNTMTELYCCIFVYFFKRHINRCNQSLHEIMKEDSNQKFILRLCKVSWHLLNEQKIVFSLSEINKILIDFDVKNDKLLGLIEEIDSESSLLYQFVHLSLMEFCAAVYAHVSLSTEEIISNKRFCSCIPIVCGLTNSSRPYINFLSNWESRNKKEDLLLMIFKSKLAQYILFNTVNALVVIQKWFSS